MDTLTKVIEIIAQILKKKIEEIKSESNLTDDLGADDLDNVEIIMECENIFNISINDGDLENIKTVGDLVTRIDKLLNPESGEGK